MITTLVLVTQSYLAYASPELWRKAAEKARLVLVLREGETPLPSILPHAADVKFIAAKFDENVTPVLMVDDLCTVLDEEVRSAGSAAAIRVLCQDECNILGVSICRERLGILGDRPEMVTRFRDKVEMKKAVAAAGIAVPLHEALDRGRTDAGYYRELRGRFGPKLVLKPTDSGGSFGIKIVEDEAGFVRAMQEIAASYDGFKYEVDEFINGKMYQCDSYISGGKVVFCSILELNCSNFDFVGGMTLAVFPLADSPLREELAEMNQRVVAALGFTEGATHHEVFQEAGTGRLVFLEIAARVAGGIGVPFHSANSNVNLIDAVVLATLGDGLSEQQLLFKSNNDVIYALLPLRMGKIVELIEPKVESTFQVDWSVSPGMTVNPKSLVDKAGVLVLRNTDHAALRRDFDSLAEYVPIRCVSSPERSGAS